MEMTVSASSTTVVRRGNMASPSAQVSDNEACNGLLMLGMWCTALHCTALYYTVLYSTVEVNVGKRLIPSVNSFVILPMIFMPS